MQVFFVIRLNQDGSPRGCLCTEPDAIVPGVWPDRAAEEWEVDAAAVLLGADARLGLNCPIFQAAFYPEEWEHGTVPGVYLTQAKASEAYEAIHSWPAGWEHAAVLQVEVPDA